MPRPSAREKLIAAALKRFQATGYSGTSIEDIADRAGVFKGSFYNHFKSKEELAIIVVDRYSSIITSNIKLEGPPSASQRLKDHFKWMALTNEKDGYRDGCLMSNFSAEIHAAGKSLRAAVAESFGRWFATLAIVVRQGQLEGEIDPRPDPDLLARFLANSWEGAVNFSKVVRNQEPLDDFFSVILLTIESKRPLPA